MPAPKMRGGGMKPVRRRGTFKALVAGPVTQWILAETGSPVPHCVNLLSLLDHWEGILDLVALQLYSSMAHWRANGVGSNPSSASYCLDKL